MSNLGTLIFDMDGTLIDSMNQHADKFSQILFEEYGVVNEVSRREYFNTAGRPLDEQFNHVLQICEGFNVENVEKLLDRFWVLVNEDSPVLFPEVKKSVMQLFQAGYLLIVISGCAPSIVKSRMQWAGLNSYFTLMLGTDKRQNMFKGKGHFTIIQRELKQEDLQFRAHSAIIGDAEYDMLIGKQAGLLTIGRVTSNNGIDLKKAGAEILINDLADLVCKLKNDLGFSSSFSSISMFKERSNESKRIT